MREILLQLQIIHVLLRPLLLWRRRPLLLPLPLPPLLGAGGYQDDMPLLEQQLRPLPRSDYFLYPC